jgi:hypothetical protein
MFFRSNATFKGFRILKRILNPLRVSQENCETFKKDSSALNKSNGSILGWYETLKRVSISFQKWFRATPFFFSVYT